MLIEMVISHPNQKGNLLAKGRLGKMIKNDFAEIDRRPPIFIIDRFLHIAIKFLNGWSLRFHVLGLNLKSRFFLRKGQRQTNRSINDSIKHKTGIFSFFRSLEKGIRVGTRSLFCQLPDVAFTSHRIGSVLASISNFP